MKYKEDGVTHINVYSHGRTKLGQALSNFAYLPFECEDGHFDSIEGYWYWLGCRHPDRDVLRTLSGYQAKKVGRDLGSPDWLTEEIFQDKIKKALEIKIDLLPSYLKDEFYMTPFPFTHYYVHDGKVVEVPKAQWILDYLTEIKKRG